MVEKIKIKLKKILTKRLSVIQYEHLKNIVARILSVFVGRNLMLLGKLFRSDKISGHNYIVHYRTHFKKYRLKKIKLLEIGVGCYEEPELGGHSLRMWKRYFPFGKIFAIDIYDKSALEERRIKIFQGNQIDKDFLEKTIEKTGKLDIIIDDGSHINEHIIETFKILFPKLKDGGLYVIEDLQTSYWEEYGGDSNNLNNPKTAMNFLKSLTDCMNNQEFLIPNYEQSYYDKKIMSMHFYHNLVFIYKNNNEEKSNIVESGKII